MRLGDFDRLQDAGEQEQVRRTIEGFNQTRRDYPRDSTVHAEFRRIAREMPDAVAIEAGDTRILYGELEERSNRLARVLLDAGARRETLVAILLDDTALAAEAMLGVLKAGAAYLPLDASAPRARLQSLLDQGAATILLSERSHMRLMNQLQWDCPSLKTVICLDSPDVHAEPETGGAFMDEDVWNLVGEEMFDDISGGGWKSSYDGQWLSRQVMDEYAANARAKIAPLVTPSSRILEIGCSSGITLFQTAPLVGRYFGTDLSAKILEKTRARVTQAGLDHVQLAALPAHETRLVPEAGFDLVILNSVVQCFRGHNYLRDVLRQAIAKMADRGYIFLGDLSDLDLKAAFLEDLGAFPGARTDRSEELYLSRAFLDDLRHDFPEIAGIECSRSLAATPCEMTLYGFDALLRIEKTNATAPPAPRSRLQWDRRALDSADASPGAECASATNLAYVIHTSGTTGRSNGVMVDHRAILRLVKNCDFVPLDAGTRLLRTAPLAFDASTLEFWGPLLNGGCLCHAPAKAILEARAVRELIAAHRINTAWFTATLFNRLVDDDVELFAGMTHVLTGGERLSPEHVARARERHPALSLINGYGPTENTTFTSCHAIGEVHPAGIPIGRPVANTQVWILDGGQLLPPKTLGELCAAGDGLARGYWRNPALTASRFTPDPLGSGGRVYRTGDRARWLETGEIQFLGREDSQVKIRGYRLELGEIETRLAGFPGVRQAVVAAIEDRAQGTMLAAYVVSDRPLDPAALRRHLGAVLPEYAIPAAFVPLDRLPLTRNGKTDKRALPQPTFGSGPEGQPLENETERQLADIWRTVLDRPGIAADSNFFDLGGHSLLVPKLIHLIRREMGLEIPLLTVFKTRTLRALSRALVEQARFGLPAIDDPVVPLSRSAASVKLFAFPPGRGDALGYGGLAEQLEGRVELYGLNFIPCANPPAEFARLILSVQPDGPLWLFGYSAGGRLAHHVAAELERRGRTVAAVIMADSSRYLDRVPSLENEIGRVVEEFLNSAEVLPLLGSGVLRDKAMQRIRAYYDYNYKTIDTAVTDAPIELIVCENGVTGAVAPSGRIAASNEAWAQSTRSAFRTYQGSGAHGTMFHPPHLETNARRIARLIGEERGKGVTAG